MIEESENGEGVTSLPYETEDKVRYVIKPWEPKHAFEVHNSEKKLLTLNYTGEVECDDVVVASEAGRVFVESVQQHHFNSVDVALRNIPEHWRLVILGQNVTDDSWSASLEFVDEDKRALSRVSGRGSSAGEAIHDGISSANAVTFRTQYMPRMITDDQPEFPFKDDHHDDAHR